MPFLSLLLSDDTNNDISVNPASSSMYTGQTKIFKAIVSGVETSNVTWEVLEGIRGGKILPDGTYNSPGWPGIFHIIATSVENHSLTAQAVNTVGEAWENCSVPDPAKAYTFD
jgi:hypothetical protein